jgi:lipopolysaccharide transport system ATP-binding protein
VLKSTKRTLIVRPKASFTSPDGGILPTIFHVTQYKAGSQWIHNLLLKCAPERVIKPKLWAEHFTRDPIIPGAIYPTVYATKSVFDRTKKPDDYRHFVILRDLRDTAVSAYFSLQVSHPNVGSVDKIRRKLNSRDQEGGMLWILKNWLPVNAKICASWIKSNENWIKYEDLLENDLPILEKVLRQCCLPELDEKSFAEAVRGCRFENLSEGRKRGEENIASHTRKGIAGDWRNHFTPKVKREFKGRYGELLILSGYEKDDNW